MTLAGRRIGLLTASASRLGGGVSAAVAAQAALLADAGAVPVVLALRDGFAALDRGRFGTAELHHLPVRGPRQLGWAPTLHRALRDARLDLLHLHGIWLDTSRAGAIWARATGRPYIVSPHGMLDPWITARGRWKKVLARWGYERASWRCATLLHALTDDEAADIARETGRADAVVVSNSAPAVAADADAHAGARGGARRGARGGVLYLGRLHPKKNLAALLAGWRRATTNDAVLTIAGWGDAAEVAAVEGAASAGVRFVGAVDGAAKAALLAGAKWLVLPSLSEGLPMAVLEAWAAGTPAIVTPACHLPQGLDTGAALCCGDTAEAIAAALGRALTMPEPAWRARSAAATALAEGPFAPATIAAQWQAIYSDLLQ